jgi:hypothetical protein
MEKPYPFAEALAVVQQECEQALSEFLGAEVAFLPADCSERRAEESAT